MVLAKPIIVTILVAFAVACGFQGKDSIVLEGTAMLPSFKEVKRLIGLSGDTVEIREGKVIINGQEMDEPYVNSRLNQSHRSQQPTFVRPNYYYVLGDNRDNSSDSRIWGLVPERYIYAKVISP